MKQNTAFLTQSEYAKLKGVTPARVNHLVKAGIIILVKGRVDPQQADSAIMGNSYPDRDDYRKLGRPISESTGVGSSYRQAATAEKFWKAKLAEMEVKVQEGKLVDAENLKRVFAKLFTDIKVRIRAIPTKCAQEIAVMKLQSNNERDLIVSIQTLLLTEFDDVLLELSQWKR